MNNERREFLNLRNVPARLDMQEAGWYLGFTEYSIPALISTGMLKPLGHPPASTVKYFATATLAKLRDDPQWLARATDALTRHWHSKNARAAAARSRSVSTIVSRRVKPESQPQRDSLTENGTHSNG